MRRYNYVWKSSDGIRHVDEMQGRSKDEVFSALRKKGIRPVRVDVQPRSWRWWAAVLSSSCLVVAAVMLCLTTKSSADRIRVSEFSKTGSSIIGQYREQMSSIQLPNGKDSEKSEEQIKRAFQIIDVTRSRLRLAYRDSGGRGLAECDRLYGNFIATLDADIERLDALRETLEDE